MNAHPSAATIAGERLARWALAGCVLAGVASCGDGGRVTVAPDAALTDAKDARVADTSDVDTSPDVGNDVAVAVDADAMTVDDALDAGGDAVAAEAGPRDAALDVAPDGSADVVTVDADAPRDAAAERASATASWTIASNAACLAAGAGCMDLGVVGGFQITASGACPTASSLQLWFPGGSVSVASGTYAVKAAAGILDVIAMPAGMVGVLAERDDAAKTHSRYWGRSGTVTVTSVGAARRVTFTGVSLREETTGAMTTLGADVSCP